MCYFYYGPEIDYTFEGPAHLRKMPEGTLLGLAARPADVWFHKGLEVQSAGAGRRAEERAAAAVPGGHDA